LTAKTILSQKGADVKRGGKRFGRLPWLTPHGEAGAKNYARGLEKSAKM